MKEVEFLANSRTAINNAQEPEIAAGLATVGIDETKRAVGDGFCTEAENKYQACQHERHQATIAHDDFVAKREEVADDYSTIRKKGRVVLAKSPALMSKLGIDKNVPAAYASWLGVVENFYTEALDDTEIQSALAEINVTVEDLTALQAKVPALKAARDNYEAQDGKSQNSTDVKDAAIKTLNDWMVDFRAKAKIAFEDNPQLMEALGVVVRRK